MPVEERRWLGLHRTASTSWGEEVADTVADARSDEWLAAWEDRWDERFTAWDDRWDERFTAWDDRWDERFAAMEHRLTTAFEQAVHEAFTAQTRALVLTLLVAVLAIAVLTFLLRG